MLGYGYGLTVVTCCRNGKLHFLIFEKHCIGLGIGVGASTGVVTGMAANGPSCDPSTYSGGFLEYGVGPWGAGIGLTDDNHSSGVNEFNGGAMYGVKVMMYCYYTLIGDLTSK